MAEASDLGQITLVLDGNRLTFDDGVWEAGPFMLKLFLGSESQNRILALSAGLEHM